MASFPEHPHRSAIPPGESWSFVGISRKVEKRSPLEMPDFPRYNLCCTA